jgi:hypothetical protein
MALFGSMNAQNLPSYLPSNGLVGWWPFNGNANDESGNGNHGVVNGATLTENRNGNPNGAYSFDGISDFIFMNIANIPIENEQRSISIWFNQSNISNSTDQASTLFHYGAIITNKRFCVVLWPIEPSIIGQNNDVSYQSGTSQGLQTNFSLNVWNHLTVTFDGNEVKCFINGVFSFSAQKDFNTQFSEFRLGKSVDSHEQGEFFNGILDDIAIYNRALTQEEITALYTGTSSNNNGGGSGGTAGTPAASVPAGIPYQAVIRDNAGAALVNAPVSVRFTLHQNTTDGTVEYQETQTLSTNAIGLINTQFGTGTATQGTFANINWSNTTKFIQVEANTGAGYVDMGTQQMMSVPFAIKSNESNKIKNAGLPVYAENAAALAGGLVAGDMYRTAAGILMIVY